MPKTEEPDYSNLVIQISETHAPLQIFWRPILVKSIAMPNSS